MTATGSEEPAAAAGSGPRVVVTDWSFPNLDLERAVLADQAVRFETYQCRDEDELIGAKRFEKLRVAELALGVGRDPGLQLVVDLDPSREEEAHRGQHDCDPYAPNRAFVDRHRSCVLSARRLWRRKPANVLATSDAPAGRSRRIARSGHWPRLGQYTPKARQSPSLSRFLRPTLPLLRQEHPDKLVKTIIPRSIRVAEEPVRGKPTVMSSPSSRAGKAFQALADEILARHAKARVVAEAPASGEVETNGTSESDEAWVKVLTELNQGDGEATNTDPLTLPGSERRF